MCLAIPGKVISLETEHGLQMGRVDIAGTVVRTCLEYIPDVAVGSYVLVHAGIAIGAVNEAEAMKTLSMLDDVLQATNKPTPSENDEVS